MQRRSSIPGSLVTAFILAAGLCLAISACGGGQSEQPQTQAAPAQSAAGEEQRYDLKGKVVSVDKPEKRLTVDHEAIPGFMGAMTMPYAVKDEQQLENLSAGDQVTAKVVAGPNGIYLDNIVVVGKEAGK